MQPSMLAKRLWLLLFLLIGCFYFWGLGLLPLVGPDEPRYAEVAREMFVRRDLITPTLGGLPWFEKPPLLYWLAIANFRFFGVSEFSARLGPAICGLLTGLFVYWIGTVAEKASGSNQDSAAAAGLGRYSALVWLSSMGAIVVSRAVSNDAAVTMTLTGTFACFLIWQLRREAVDNRGQALLLVGFYVFIGLSLLAKGLIGLVIPIGVIALYFLLRRSWPERRFLASLGWGMPLAGAVAAVWYGPMIARHGWTFIDQFIIQHHFARFVTNKYHHPQPVYFYLLVILALSLPWTVMMLVGFGSFRRMNWRGSQPTDQLRVFGLAWIVVPVVFFSLSGSKLMAYILPVMPAVAILVGERITCFLQAQRGNRVLRLTGLLVLVLGLVGSWYLLRRSTVDAFQVTAAALPLVIFAFVALVRPQMRRVLFVAIAIAMIGSSAIAIRLVVPLVARPESVRDLMATASSRGFGSAPVVQLHAVDRTAEFYAAGRLSYRLDGEPIKFEGAAQVADAARSNGGLVLCIVPLEFESQLTAYERVHSEVIGNNGKVSLVVVRVP